MHVIYGENCRKKAIENAMQKKNNNKKHSVEGIG